MLELYHSYYNLWYFECFAFG